MAAVLTLAIVLGLVSPAAGQAVDPSRFEEEAATITEAAREAVEQFLPARRNDARDGIFVLVSFSLDGPTLQTLFDQARLLGARILFQGLPEHNMQRFMARLKEVLEIRDRAPDGATLDEVVAHPADVALDPVVFRDLGIDRVPALVIRHGSQMIAVVGNGDVPRYLEVLAREQPAYRPLADWYRRRWRGWLQGGPTDEPRPALPPIAVSQVYATGVPGVAIAEANLLEVIQRRVAQVDWTGKARDWQRRVEARLKDGPGLVLPTERTTRTYRVDPTVTIDHEVRDEEGRLLVAAGQRINPLERIVFPKTYVILDATDLRQMAAVEAYLATVPASEVTVMITRGDVRAVMERFRREVFWATRPILERFGVTAVPALVKQAGSDLAVTVLGIH
ncbi:MAG: hypothetical protein D6690_12405 [Nitrospirae bacterium]|nr:MAG: hypothetical protein D6690_12405 [Nitrospirota bacterium]